MSRVENFGAIAGRTAAAESMQQNKQEKKKKHKTWSWKSRPMNSKPLLSRSNLFSQPSSWIQASHWWRSSAATIQSPAAAAAAAPEPRPGPSVKGHRLEINVEWRERGRRRKTSGSPSHGPTSRKSEALSQPTVSIPDLLRLSSTSCDVLLAAPRGSSASSRSSPSLC